MNRSKRGHASGSNSISSVFVFFGGFGMTDRPQEEKQTTPLSIAFNIIDRWKLKQPSCLPLLPPEFFPAIGKVATAWGMFETLFDNLLIALMKGGGSTDEKWRGLSFRKRRNLCRKKMHEVLSQCPKAIADVDAALTGSESLYPKRNLIVHGRMSTCFKTSVKDGERITEISLECAGRYSGNEVREVFTADELDDLYYEIAHLCGLINSVSTASLGLPQASPEIQTLRDFLSNNHPTYPNPTRLAPPPQS
jgi:hypothetical protein